MSQQNVGTREDNGIVSAPLSETAGRYEMARCGLPGCGEDLHMVITSDQPVYLSFTAEDFRNPADWDSHWEVRCEAGHVVLLPPDHGGDISEFGHCRCDPDAQPDADALCGHGDMARLRAITSEAANS